MDNRKKFCVQFCWSCWEFKSWLSRFSIFHTYIYWSMKVLEKGLATHSSILAWRIPRTEESGGLQSIGLQRVGHDWSDLAAAAVADLDEVVKLGPLYEETPETFLPFPLLCENTSRGQPSIDLKEKPYHELIMLAPWMWTSILQNCEKINFLFKPPSQLYFAMAAWAD